LSCHEVRKRGGVEKVKFAGSQGDLRNELQR
jgi:hypothetical protein